MAAILDIATQISDTKTRCPTKVCRFITWSQERIPSTGPLRESDTSEEKVNAWDGEACCKFSSIP